MRRLTFFFLCILTACSNRNSIPDNIIPPDSMQKIMLDVITANEYANLYISKDSLKHDKAKANQDLLEAIFKIHHVTRAGFQASLRFYESRPDLNKNIFDSLAAYANRHRPELYRNSPPIKLPAKPALNPQGKSTLKPATKPQHNPPPKPSQKPPPNPQSKPSQNPPPKPSQKPPPNPTTVQ